MPRSRAQSHAERKPCRIKRPQCEPGAAQGSKIHPLLSELKTMPIRFSLRQMTRQLRAKWSVVITRSNIGGIPIWFSTSRAAPLSEIFRTRQSMVVVSLVLHPNVLPSHLGTSCVRAAIDDARQRRSGFCREREARLTRSFHCRDQSDRPDCVNMTCNLQI
jgi:hypothetical protein